MPGLTIDQMLELGWTWNGPVQITEEDGSHFELRIEELPDFFLAAETYEALLRELKPALRAFLLSYIEHGETPPLPPLDHWIFTSGARAEGMPQTGRVQQGVVAAA